MSYMKNWKTICDASLFSVISGNLISREVISRASIELGDEFGGGVVPLNVDSVRKAIISALSHASDIEKRFRDAIKDIEHAAGISPASGEFTTFLTNKVSGLAEDAELLEKATTELNQLRKSKGECDADLARGIADLAQRAVSDREENESLRKQIACRDQRIEQLQLEIEALKANDGEYIPTWSLQEAMAKLNGNISSLKGCATAQEAALKAAASFSNELATEQVLTEGEYSCVTEPDDHHEWGVYYEAPHNPSLGAEFSPACFFSSANRALDYANAMNRRNAARRSGITFYVMKTL